MLKGGRQESRALGLQAALGEVIRDVEVRDRVEQAPERSLADLGVGPEDAQGMLSSGVQRLIAYHVMAHSRLFGTVRTFLGRAAEERGDAGLRRDLDGFIQERGGSVTPYLRDVPGEFFAWVEPRWAADESLPAWLGELGALEILTRKVRNDPAEVGPMLDRPIDLERPVVVNASARLVRYTHAVHQLRTSANPSTIPELAEGGGCWVLVYRHADEVVRFVDIKERSAQMLRRLITGESLRAALFGACEATGETLDDAILSVTAVTLADLMERHVLLGGG